MSESKKEKKQKRRKTVQYDRWGYFFIAPFFLIFTIFSLIPLVTTFVYSFFENYRDGLTQIGPNISVQKYFNGTRDIYGWQLDSSQDGMNELIATYKGESTTPDLADKVVEFLSPSNSEDPNFEVYTDNNFRRAAFASKVSKLVDNGVKKGLPAVDVLNQIKDELPKKQASFTRNIQNVFASGDNVARYFLNTLIMWAIGFIPQILISLILAVWFTNTELKLKFQQFFKTVIYMPNLIMASAFAMLFFTLFSPNGPIELLIQQMGLREAGDPIRFFTRPGWTRALVGVMNFLMWYGNTTILLMAGIMGIDNSLFEASRIDGASPLQTFFKVTVPLLLPIFVYVMITSLIGGIQMFDVPQILTKGSGAPNRTTMTIIMKLNNYLTISKNFGNAGCMSILIFAVTGALSGLVYKMTMQQYRSK
ncbi:MAG: sugar ABC transporter permease [Treponema sp.]|nr:sugar ABC transporter permease [Treponema sp.]